MNSQQLLAHYDNGQYWSQPISATEGYDTNAAYRDALAVRDSRIARGEIPRGYKIGFTNRTIWTRYNCESLSACNVTSSVGNGSCRCGLLRSHDTRRPKSPMALLDYSVRSPMGIVDEMCSRSGGLLGLEPRPERGYVPGRSSPGRVRRQAA